MNLEIIGQEEIKIKQKKYMRYFQNEKNIGIFCVITKLYFARKWINEFNVEGEWLRKGEKKNKKLKT